MNKVRAFLKKKHSLSIEVDNNLRTYECKLSKLKLPKSTYITKKITLKYYSINYFPYKMNGPNDYFFSLKHNLTIASQVDYEMNNFNTRYFDYVLRLPTNSSMMNKELLDYEWLNKCNLYIKKLSIIDKFALYGYSIHGDRYVNNYLRGTLNLLQLRQSIGLYGEPDSHFNPLFFEYIWSKGDYQKFIKAPFSEQKQLYKEYCKQMVGLPLNELKNIVINYKNRLSRILSSSPPLKYPMVFFRGTKGSYFNNKAVNKPFVHNGFMSVSLDYRVALQPYFISSSSEKICCLMVVYALPGTRLLPITGLSQINSEKEFLFDTGAKIVVTNKSKNVEYIPNVDICKNNTSKQLNVTQVIIG